MANRSNCEGVLIDGLFSDKVQVGHEREITQMKELQLYSWIREADTPPGKSILLNG